MTEEILDFIYTNRIAVLAVQMPDNTPHGATVHYASIVNLEEGNPLQFLFMTNGKTRKAEAIAGGGNIKASVVVGFNETEMKTFQADGEVRQVSASEQETFKQTFLGKFPEKAPFVDKPDSVFLVFTPTWWRYTDWGSLTDRKVVTSTD